MLAVFVVVCVHVNGSLALAPIVELFLKYEKFTKMTVLLWPGPPTGVPEGVGYAAPGPGVAWDFGDSRTEVE